ncbi:MAG: zinc ABC transporter substrate-binding protein [Victivallales bacterium]|nr:zinc ABC transporter substrate-binding protein [Victivallales bacterium]
MLGKNVFMVCYCVLSLCLSAVAEAPRVLCTTFPIYHATRNVVEGRKGVDVGLLLPANLGCPHDYSLTPADMQQIQKADVLVINGLGMEEFVGRPLQRANPKIKVVDSSKGIPGLIEQEGHHHHHHDEADGHDDEEEDDHDADRHHFNPHLFASPKTLALVVMNIADGLSGVDPEGAEIYKANAAKYSESLVALSGEVKKLKDTLANPRIITQHGAFDYFARDAGLEIVATIQSHPGQEPSAAEMLKLVGVVREKKPGAVFTEPQYPARIAETLSRETGIKVAKLDPVASGPESAPKDYYIKTMRENIEMLKKTLGTK